MRYLITLLIMLFAVPVYAEQWCQWDGSAPENCQRDKYGVIKVDGKGKSGGAENFASFGFYKQVTMPNPEMAEGNMWDDWSYVLVDNEIQRTRTQIAKPPFDLAKAKLEIITAEIALLEKEAKDLKYKKLNADVFACADMDCLYALKLKTLPEPLPPVDIPTGTY